MVVRTGMAQHVLFDPALKKGQDLDFCVRLQGAGARFRMIDQPLTIWLDATEAGRTSYVKGYERSEEHTSELQSLMRISYAVFCLKKKTIISDSQKRMTEHTTT